MVDLLFGQAGRPLVAVRLLDFSDLCSRINQNMKSLVVIDAVIEKGDQFPQVIVKGRGFDLSARRILVSRIYAISPVAFDMNFLDFIERFEFRELLAQKFRKPAL